jgi:hypothetical protein
MTDVEIEQKFALKVKEERRITNELIGLIALVEERRIFAKQGYPSLFDWLTKKYGYSEGAANRRISAARLLRSVPEISSKLAAGDLNLTTVAKAHSIIRAAEKVTKSLVPAENKLQALLKIENKSSVQAEQTLLSIFPEAATQVQRTHIRTVDATNSRLSANIPNEVMARFEQVRDLISHAVPNASFVEAADYLFEKLLKDQAADEDFTKDASDGRAVHDLAHPAVPTVRAAAAAKRCVNNQNKSITPRTRRIVLQEQSCTYKDPETGRVCGSRYQLQVDHRRPRAMGGTNHIENLRPLCSTHNRLGAELVLGKICANKWRETVAASSP